MNKLVSLALIATSLAVSARALLVGVDAGLLVDASEEYVSARVGHVLKSTTNLNHQVEAEIGLTRQKESGLGADFMPVTVNYRAESKAEKLGYYFGAGAGFARTKVEGFYSSRSDTSLALQAFTGLSYSLSAKVSLHAGVKYIWIDDVRLYGYKTEVGDDVAVTAGLSVKF